MVVRLISTYIFVVVVFILGCVSRPTREVCNTDQEKLYDVITFSTALFSYIEAKNALPNSVEDIKNFCSEPSMPCYKLDWSKFTLQKIDDKNIKIKYRDGEFILPFAMGKSAEKVDAGTDIHTLLKKRLKEELDKGFELGESPPNEVNDANNAK